MYVKKYTIAFIIIIICIFNTLNANSIKILEDFETKYYLKDIVGALLKSAQLKPNSVPLYLVNDRSPNAFVAGGRNMFIHIGLITYASTDDEIAGVLAHELGHITEGHLIRGTNYSQKTSSVVLLSLLAGIASSLIAPQHSIEIISSAYINGISTYYSNVMRFSRIEEQQADQKAIEYLHNTQYSPYGIIQFMTKLSLEEPILKEGQPKFVSSHPATQSRIDFYYQYTKTIYGKNYKIVKKDKPSTALKFIKAKIKAFNNPIYKPKSLVLDTDKYITVLYYQYHQFYDKALKILDTLMVDYPQYLPFLVLKGELLIQAKKPQQAIKILTKASSYYHNYIIYYLLGKAYFLNHQYNEAIKNLNISIYSNKYAVGAMHYKSIIYFLKKDYLRAKLYNGQEAFTKGNVEKARFLITQLNNKFPKNSSEDTLVKDLIRMMSIVKK